MKRGVSERKESTAEGRVGGEVLVGVAENRRRKDTQEVETRSSVWTCGQLSD